MERENEEVSLSHLYVFEYLLLLLNKEGLHLLTLQPFGLL